MNRTKSLDNISILKYCLGITFYFFFILNIFSIGKINKAWAVSSPITPTPSMNTGTCKAVVTYSWNVSGIPNANRVLWELKKGSDFTNLEGPENGRETYGTSNNLQGSVTIDLRDYGQVLNGTRYYFRAVAKDGTNDVARRSNSVKFDLNYSPDNTYSANTFAQDPYQVRLDWSGLKSEIDNCSDRVYYEVKKNSAFTNLTGAESGRIDSGSSTGSFTTINLSQQQPGDYYVRIVGKSGGTSVNDDVGKRGSGVKVTIGQQDTTPPAEQFQPVNITTQTLRMTGLRTVPEARLNIKVKDASSGSFLSSANVNVKNSTSSQNTPRYNSTQLTNTSGIAVFRNLLNGGKYDLKVSYTGCDDSTSQHTMPDSGNSSKEISINCGTEADSPTQPIAISEDLVTRPAGNIKVDRSRTINLDLNSFKIGEGTGAQNKVQTARYDVPITYNSTGLNPAYYRVRKCPITNAEWKPLSPGSTPTIDLLRAGKDRYCFQLKSSTNIESNILEKNYFVKLEERTFSSDAKPIAYAKQKGFKFGARDLTAGSTCAISSADETLAWNFTKDVKCKFSLFQGRKLKFPWKVKEVIIVRQSPILGTDRISSNTDNDDKVDFIRKPSGDSLYFTFTVEDRPYAKELGTNNPNVAAFNIYSFEYVLEGPTGINTFDAFD